MPQAEKPSPLVGEGGGGEADERGKLEKKRKNRNTCEQNTTTILTCVRTLAPFASQAGTSLRVRGKLTLRKKKIIVFIFLYTLLTISYAGFFAPDHTLFECFGPLRMLTTAQEWRQSWIVFFNGINCLPVILERRKNAVGSREIKKCGKEWRIWQRIQVLIF